MLAARTVSSGVGGGAGQRQQRVAHEDVERDHHRDRVAGQAEQQGAAGRRLSMRPMAIGRPGRIAMCQNITSPSARHHGLV